MYLLLTCCFSLFSPLTMFFLSLLRIGLIYSLLFTAALSVSADPLRLFGVSVRDSNVDANVEISSQSARLIDLISKLFEGREEFAVFEQQGTPYLW